MSNIGKPIKEYTVTLEPHQEPIPGPMPKFPSIEVPKVEPVLVPA